METGERISRASILLEARIELRSNLALETRLIEYTSQLPEDDFCCHAREAFQLGAGYGLLRAEADEYLENDELEGLLDETALAQAFDIFLWTEPQNRYRSDYEQSQLRLELYNAALGFEAGQNFPSHLDEYKIAAGAAFLDGYIITVSTLYVALWSEPLEPALFPIPLEDLA